MIAKFSNVFTRWESFSDSNEVYYFDIDELLDDGFPVDKNGYEMKTNGTVYLRNGDEYIPLNL
jgi:hypothetical protein